MVAYLQHTHEHQSDCNNKMQCCHKLLKIVKTSEGEYRDGLKLQKNKNKGSSRSFKEKLAWKVGSYQQREGLNHSKQEISSLGCNPLQC